MEQSQLNNGILRRLASEDFVALSPYLRRVEFAYEEELITPNVPIPTDYFIESGMLSMVVSSHGSEPIEVGLIGREGMTDHVVELGDRSVLRCFAHVAGAALAVDAAEFAKWLRTRPAAFLVPRQAGKADGRNQNRFIITPGDVSVACERDDIGWKVLQSFDHGVTTGSRSSERLGRDI